MIYKVTTNSAPIKKQPTSNSEIVGRLDRNVQIDIIGIENRWASFIYEDNTCYISSMYIKKEEKKQVEKNVLEENIVEEKEEEEKEALEKVVVEEKEEKEVPDKNVVEEKEEEKVGDNTQIGSIKDESADTDILSKHEIISGKVNIKYVDYDDKSEILPEVKYEMLDLNNYIFNAKYIPGYFNVEYSYAEIELDKNAPEQNIEFYYKKRLGKINIKYIDIATREEIAKPTNISEVKFDSYVYTAQEVAGYNVVGPNSKSIKIDETLVNYNAYFEYEKSDVEKE